MSGAQAPYARVPLADGTLVPTAEIPSDDLIPHLLATSDVLGTGWYAADAARVREGSTVVVVGDGAVGLMGVLSAKQMGAERIIAMSRHKSRQDLALAFGATDIVAERGEEGVARVKELTRGVGADSVLECVGTQEAMKQAIDCARPGGSIGFVGVPHGVEFDGQELFFAQKRLLGGPAPVRRFLPDLIDRVLTRKIEPGKVFDLELPIAEVAEGYRAMDEDDAERILPPPMSRRPADPEPVAELLPRSTFGARPHQLGVVALEETVPGDRLLHPGDRRGARWREAHLGRCCQRQLLGGPLNLRPSAEVAADPNWR